MNNSENALKQLESLYKEQKISSDNYEEGLDRIYHIDSDISEGKISENRVIKNYQALKTKLLKTSPVDYVNWLLTFYYTNNIAIKDTKQHTSIITKILNVEIVDGSSLKPTWRSPMQKIFTSSGNFIDVSEAYGGQRWKDFLNANVQVNIKNSAGYQWIKLDKVLPEVAVKKEKLNILDNDILSKIKKYDTIINTPNIILDINILESIDASSLIIKCGKIIEKIIENLYSQQFSDTCTLHKMIQKLHEINILDRKAKTYAHFIRSYRNIESHNTDVESTKDDTTVILLSLTQFIETLENQNIFQK